MICDHIRKEYEIADMAFAVYCNDCGGVIAVDWGDDTIPDEYLATIDPYEFFDMDHVCDESMYDKTEDCIIARIKQLYGTQPPYPPRTGRY